MDIKMLGPISLADLLGGSGAGEREASSQAPIPEAQVATLLEVVERYRSPCPFQVGDIVTPRAGYLYTGAGTPFVVLEVAAHPAIAEEGNAGSPTFRARMDVRVAGRHVGTGDICAWWQESWMLEAYTGGATPGGEA